MSRVRREYSESGCYHLMLRGNERKIIFLDDSDYKKFVAAIARKKSENDFSLYAYCLMNNHIHLVLREINFELSSIISGIATSYAMYFNKKYDRVGHVFQGRFRSEPIEDDRHLLAVIRYVHNNPVKAGLSAEPGHYKWSSYHFYVNNHEQSGQMVDTDYILQIISNQAEMAVEEFKRFSIQIDARDFLDDEESIRTMEEGKFYLEKYLQRKWPWISQDDVLNNRAILQDVIAELRSNTDLSIQKIADLLEINRGRVERVK